MKIAAASIQLSSSHTAFQRTEVSERLEMWVGARRPEMAVSDNRGLAIADAARAQVRLSREAVAAQESEAVSAETDPLESDPRLKLIRNLVEMLTGRTVRTMRIEDFANQAHPGRSAPTPPAGGNAPASAGFGIDYSFESRYTEFEQTTFQAQGMIRTTDGREIHFDISFAMQRSYSESTSVRFLAGDAVQLKDPLVLDFGGPAAALSNTRFAFDLDGDGQLDQLPMLAGGTGFLAIDRNGNGRIDDGRELFGPMTGNGFAELAALDADGNGWIDEADPAFDQLRIWRPDAEGKGTLMTLTEAGVGALYLGNVSTPFDLRGSANETLGVMRTSSIYVRDDGTAGTVSQIDLSV